jgi:hypothetical protein
MVFVLAATGYGASHLLDSSFQRQKLASWGITPNLFNVQHALNRLDIQSRINDLTWLRSTRLQELRVASFGSPSFQGAEYLDGLTSLSIEAGVMKDLKGLETLKHLRSLSFGFAGLPTKDLKRLETLKI